MTALKIAQLTQLARFVQIRCQKREENEPWIIITGEQVQQAGVLHQQDTQCVHKA